MEEDYVSNSNNFLVDHYFIAHDKFTIATDPAKDRRSRHVFVPHRASHSWHRSLEILAAEEGGSVDFVGI